MVSSGTALRPVNELWIVGFGPKCAPMQQISRLLSSIHTFQILSAFPSPNNSQRQSPSIQKQKFSAAQNCQQLSLPSFPKFSFYFPYLCFQSAGRPNPTIQFMSGLYYLLRFALSSIPHSRLLAVTGNSRAKIVVEIKIRCLLLFLPFTHPNICPYAVLHIHKAQFNCPFSSFPPNIHIPNPFFECLNEQN